ncbi:MAG: hypothetical protein M1829_006845 [Trizodia sp. TS-e1964]|nr:MAG: hypothetical protein M1829_006845 [Trizodia sp. TS-e1964]
MMKTTSDGRRRSIDTEPEIVGVLPWASNTERALASGPLRIYLAHSEVAFLHSSSVLHPIRKKSRCWCVDGHTKFVLRIGPYNYWRIELPNSTEEDLKRAADLKAVLIQILQYEKTPCPFKRGFTVELPDLPKTPVKMRPWKPKERLQSRKPLETCEPEYTEGGTSTPAISENGIHGDEESCNSDASDDTNDTPRGVIVARTDLVSTDALRTPTRPNGYKNTRCVTALTELSIETACPSTSPTPIKEIGTLQPGNSNPSSSVDSFKSFQSPLTPFLPSPPLSNPGSPLAASDSDNLEIRLTAKSSQCQPVEISDLTFGNSKDGVPLPLAIDTEEIEASSSPPAWQPDGDLWLRSLSQPQSALHERSMPSRRRTLSPMPLPANIFTPTKTSGHELSTAIIQKTCSIMLGPPAQLISLMLRIAAKIASGALRGATFNTSGKKRIPCQWDSSDLDEMDEEEWDEDDFGISLKPVQIEGATRSEVGTAWEVD